MSYKSLRDSVNDLERNGMLLRIKSEVDPNLEMAEIHRRVFEAKGPAKVAKWEPKHASKAHGSVSGSSFGDPEIALEAPGGPREIHCHLGWGDFGRSGAQVYKFS